MSVHFHTLTISSIVKDTATAVVITFDVPDSLKAVFQFTQGQNLTIKTKINGEELRRSYSICTAPFENKLSIAVKKVDLGRFSCYANAALKKGDVLEVLPPTGSFFTRLNSTTKKNYLAFAAGSGITPILSIIKTTLAVEPASNFSLVYGNKSRGSIMFFEALEGLKNKYLHRFNFINLLSQERTDAAINYGRIDTAKLAELQKLVDYKSMDEIFICGPSNMLFTVKEYLEAKGIVPGKIHFELFTTQEYGTVAPNMDVATSANAEAESQVTIRLDGRSFDFKLPMNGDSILNAALNLGADLPYACKGGVCSTCKARLIEGAVNMKVNYALGEAELEAGFILTCQSQPVSGKIVVDFDAV